MGGGGQGGHVPRAPSFGAPKLKTKTPKTKHGRGDVAAKNETITQNMMMARTKISILIVFRSSQHVKLLTVSQAWKEASN